MSTSPPSRRGPWVATAAALLVLPFAFAACRSMDKPTLAARLADLQKNRRLAAAGLLHATVGEHDLTYVRLAASDDAGGARRPVVFVHGTPSTLYTWGELALGRSGPDGFAGLASEREVVLLELPGHGVARTRLTPATFQGLAEFVVTALDALGLSDVHLVGQSYGGEVAWRAALDAPGRVRSLTVIDSSGLRRADDAWLPEEVAMRENPLAKLGWLLNSEERVERALAPHFRVVPPDRAREMTLCCSNRANWATMVDLARDENGTRQDELARLAVPTLVLWGADDLAYPAQDVARRFAEAIPDAQLRVLPETGHYPHEERPAEVLAALRAHFVEVER